MSPDAENVRLLRKTGSDRRTAKAALLTPMYGPAVRCKRFRQPGRCGLASMYPASDWSACGAPGHHGYQRAFELISGPASNGPFGSPVFACAGKTDPPSLSHLLADLGGDVGYVIDSSSLRAVPWFVPGGRSFVPACARRRAARKGAVKAGRRLS